MEFTGERFIPNLGGVIELEHVHRYLWTKPFLSGKKVLDIACGEGYGSAYLAQFADSVLGVDLDESSIRHARETYNQIPNLEFVIGSLLKIPLEDSSMDVVICFESLEHVTEHEVVIQEIKRVLKKDGVLVLSTPNKLIYSDATGYKNPFHPKELYRDELEKLIETKFRYRDIFGQRVMLSSIIVSEGTLGIQFLKHQRHSHGDFVDCASYFMVVASDKKIEIPTNSIYEGLSTLDDLLYSRPVVDNFGSALKILFKQIPFLVRIYRRFK